MLVRGFLPLSEAMVLIEKSGFDFGMDRWELWVRRGLMPRSERIAGTNLYGLGADQWTRLKILIMIHRDVFGRKSPEAVAYWASLWGIEVPANLVAAHMTKSIKTFYAMMRRRNLQVSNRRIHPETMVESEARKLATTMARDLLRIANIRNAIKRQFLTQFAEEFSFLVVCMTYNVLPVNSLSNVFRKIGRALFTLGTVAAASRVLRKVVESERDRFVDPTVGHNKILKEIDVTQRDRPQLLLRACQDSGLALAAGQRAFGYDQMKRKRRTNASNGKERETARIFFAVIPLVSAYFLAFNLEDPNSPFLATLRQSHGAVFEQQVRRLDRISEWQRRRLERGL